MGKQRSLQPHMPCWGQTGGNWSGRWDGWRRREETEQPHAGWGGKKKEVFIPNFSPQLHVVLSSAAGELAGGTPRSPAIREMVAWCQPALHRGRSQSPQPRGRAGKEVGAERHLSVSPRQGWRQSRGAAGSPTPARPGLPVPVLQQRLEVWGTNELVLDVAKDDHLACPVVPDADGHQLLFQRGGGKKNKPPVSSPTPRETCERGWGPSPRLRDVPRVWAAGPLPTAVTGSPRASLTPPGTPKSLSWGAAPKAGPTTPPIPAGRSRVSPWSRPGSPCPAPVAPSPTCG